MNLRHHPAHRFRGVADVAGLFVRAHGQHLRPVGHGAATFGHAPGAIGQGLDHRLQLQLRHLGLQHRLLCLTLCHQHALHQHGHAHQQHRQRHRISQELLLQHPGRCQADGQRVQQGCTGDHHA